MTCEPRGHGLRGFQRGTYRLTCTNNTRKGGYGEQSQTASSNLSARVGVHPEYRDIIGRSETLRSLGTRDRRAAKRLKYAVIADIKAEHERLIREAGTPVRDPEWLLKVARELRSQVAAGVLDTETAGELLATMREKHR